MPRLITAALTASTMLAAGVIALGTQTTEASTKLADPLCYSVSVTALTTPIGVAPPCVPFCCAVLCQSPELGDPGVLTVEVTACIPSPFSGASPSYRRA